MLKLIPVHKAVPRRHCTISVPYNVGRPAMTLTQLMVECDAKLFAARWMSYRGTLAVVLRQRH